MWDFAGADHGHIARENRLRTKLGKQRDLLQLLSVGFSTRSIRMQAACPPCNTPPGPQSR